MRVVYGAGALAAVSVMAVGLFKPDFGATADQLLNADGAATTDAQAPNEALGAHEARNEARRDRDRDTRRRVVRYVYLNPGERAPRGADVISAEEAARRLGTEPETRANGSRSNNTRQPSRPSPPRQIPTAAQTAAETTPRTANRHPIRVRRHRRSRRANRAVDGRARRARARNMVHALDGRHLEGGHPGRSRTARRCHARGAASRTARRDMGRAADQVQRRFRPLAAERHPCPARLGATDAGCDPPLGGRR